MANRDYIIFDFETGSRNPHKTQPTQIAAIALDGRNLAVKGQFNSEIQPIFDDEKAISLGLDPIEDEALKITNKTRDQLAEAPSIKSVWSKFTKFVSQYNWKGDTFFNPIPVGFNIIGFDLIIVDRLCREYGPYDSERNQQKLFSKVYKIDINLLKELINDCGEFNDKTNLKIKWKGNKMEGGNLYIALYKD
jgi:DNA polymerase III epsilon subunit-like protein